MHATRPWGQRGMKWRYARNSSHREQASSSVPKVKDTDWRRSLNSLKASLVTKAENFLSIAGKMKNVIINITPCVVVTSLETDAYMAIVACVDKLMVRATWAQGREEGTHGTVAILRKKGPRLCVSQLWSNEFYSADIWRIGIERFGGTHLKFSGCIE